MYKIKVHYGCLPNITSDVDVYTEKTLTEIEAQISDIVIGRIKLTDGVTVERLKWWTILNVEKINGVVF